MVVSILGSAGWMPSKGRETACVMVRGENTLLLLDAGTGVSNLSHYESLLDNYETVYVFLSHYHLDHTIGICYLCKWFRNTDIVFLVPGKQENGRTARAVLDSLLNPESFSLKLDEIASSVRIMEYQEFVPFAAGEFTLEAKKQVHSSPSFAVMVDNAICYATDTIADYATFEWAHEVKAIFHECWSINKDDSAHSSFEELSELMKHIDDGQLFLVHQNPDLSIQNYMGLCKTNPNVVVAEDLMTVEL